MMHALHRDCRLPLPDEILSRYSYLAVVHEASATQAREPERWRIDRDLDASWIVVRHDAAHHPTQGWKLHISATLWSAEEVLRKALGVLLAEAVCFKVAAAPDVLAGLN